MNQTANKLSKGEETRAAILKAALKHASVAGFEGLTIGTLAAETGMSKSGLFAHFGSKEELQIATLDEGIRRFSETTMMPALSAPRGLKRLQAMCDNWLNWTARNDLAGCPMMTASQEFDNKPGPVRDAVVAHMQRLHQGLVKSVQMAIDNGEFAAGIDAEQVAFELFGIISSCYRARNLFHDKFADQRARRAFERLIDSCRALPAQAQRSASAAAPTP
ncbi:MAG TPA: TetR/AcrR family transcriptional regulator [Usitatibacteraceae bacterium]